MPARLFAVLLGLSACVGEVSATDPELAQYEWVAEVTANPAVPVAGRRLSFTVELTSHSNQPVVVDVVLRARRADGSLLHEQRWRGLLFRPAEVWNLTQGFITSTSEQGEALVSVELVDSETQRPLWAGEGPTLTFR